MNPDAIKTVLLYSLVFNYLVLIIWFGVFSLAHDSLYRIHNRWFGLSVETFNAIHYASMAFYKIGILLLNMAPLIAFWLV